MFRHELTDTRIASTTKQFDPFIKTAHALKSTSEAKSTHTKVWCDRMNRSCMWMNKEDTTHRNCFLKNFFRSTFRVSIRSKLHLSSSRIKTKKLFWTLIQVYYCCVRVIQVNTKFLSVQLPNIIYNQKNTKKYLFKTKFN